LFFIPLCFLPLLLNTLPPGIYKRPRDRPTVTASKVKSLYPFNFHIKGK
jgi:hypothetical protein